MKTVIVRKQWIESKNLKVFTPLFLQTISRKRGVFLLYEKLRIFVQSTSIICFLIFFTGCSNKNNERIKTQEPEKNEQNSSEIVGEKESSTAEISVGEASTPILDDGENRVGNIHLACSAVSGHRLLPNEEFSFNKVVGPRKAELGYKKAPVLVNGEKVDGIGGGICQVSTTIYMAALNGGFEIKERHGHGKPAVYAPVGLDATVVYNTLDLRFINNTSNTVYIYTWVENGLVYAKIIKKHAASPNSRSG